MLVGAVLVKIGIPGRDDSRISTTGCKISSHKSTNLVTVNILLLNKDPYDVLL